MRFDVNSGSRPTIDADKAAGVGRAAAIYAKKQLPPAPGTHPMGPGSPGERPHVSPMGQLLRDLHGLKSDDPNAFAKVTASIATRLQEIAASEPEDVADRLNHLADRFSQASQTGNLSAFRPTDQTPARGLHGAAAYARSSREDRAEIRQEVRSAIDDVLSQYIVDLPQPTSTMVPAGDAPTDEPARIPKVMVSA